MSSSLRKKVNNNIDDLSTDEKLKLAAETFRKELGLKKKELLFRKILEIIRTVKASHEKEKK